MIDQNTLPTMQEFKDEARQLRKDNPNISNHTTALNLLSKKYGSKNWTIMRTMLKDEPQYSEEMKKVI